VIVADASALLDLLLRRPAAAAIEAEISPELSLHAPHLLDTEVLHGLRRWVGRGDLSPGRAQQAIEALAAFPLIRHPQAPLSNAVWALRDRLSAYDAAYATLAQGLGARLLTCDRRLARGAVGLVDVTDLSR
jgi:predicted nucleic acid-binding protein